MLGYNRKLLQRDKHVNFIKKILTPQEAGQIYTKLFRGGSLCIPYSKITLNFAIIFSKSTSCVQTLNN